MKRRKSKAVVIGIMGSHCTGKTTLMKNLMEMFERDEYNVHIMSEVARKIRRNKLGTMNAQKEILYRIMCELERVVDQGFDVVITDRTPLDNLAYSLYYAVKYSWSKEECMWIKESLRNVKSLLRLYDVLIYADNVGKIPIVDDGFRLTDNESRIIVDVYCKFMWYMVKDDGIVCLKWDVDRDIDSFYWTLKEIVNGKLRRW